MWWWHAHVHLPQVVRTMIARGMDPGVYSHEFEGTALGKAITACHFDTAQVSVCCRRLCC